jgi:ABC-type glutathione transport system ATPase component
MPKTYGQVQPPWFFLQPSYWKGGSKSSSSNSGSAGQMHAHTSSTQDTSGQLQPQSEHTDLLKVTGGTSAHVEVVDLGKTYISSDGSSRVAVQGLSMQLAAGRVAALLGRNGAGKSTVIHMLTGESSQARQHELQMVFVPEHLDLFQVMQSMLTGGS